MEEFDASLRSLLELLVPIALIPGAPERLDKTDANYWNLMDERRGGLLDQWQLDMAVAIAAHLVPQQVAHEHLKRVKPPSREYGKIKQAALTMSESYGQALRARSLELWLTGTSIAGQRKELLFNLKDQALIYDARAYQKARKLVSLLRNSTIAITEIENIDHMTNEHFREITGRSFV